MEAHTTRITRFPAARAPLTGEPEEVVDQDRGDDQGQGMDE